MVQVVGSTGFGVVAGATVYALRGSALLASLFSTMPLWSVYDPLPVLANTSKKKEIKDKNESATETQKPGLEIDSLFGD